MIKKLINKLLGKAQRSTPSFGRREHVPHKVHGIDLALVDKRAVDVVHTLQQAGFEAYIVGGAVRDLLLGLRPKDFDVATNATPEQVKALFRRAFIIGRRFRIVHVVYGRGRDHEVIEVSTFRAYLDASTAEQVSGNERTSKQALAGMTHAVDASGRVLRDNVWGPQDEDATRRDFTINAMYYDPATQVVVDYHKGIRDTQKKVLRMIGEPGARYREDPVRILRAVRFAAKLSALGFTLESKTAAPLKSSQVLLADVPQSRMFDEMLKLLQTGHALATVEQLNKLGLSQGIYPLLDLVVQRAQHPFVHAALQDTDRRVNEGKTVAPSFLLAAVLWQDVHDGWKRRLEKKYHPFPALQEAIDEAFDARIGDVSGRGKLGADMREIWNMQPRFEKRTGRSPYSLMEQPRFRAGFDFMRLRADVGEVDEALVEWWEQFSTADDEVRRDLIDQVREEQRAQQRQARTTHKSSGKAQTDRPTHSTSGADSAALTDAPPHADVRVSAVAKKRRTQAQFTFEPSEPSEHPSVDGAHAPVEVDVVQKKRRRRRKPSSATGSQTSQRVANDDPSGD